MKKAIIVIVIMASFLTGFIGAKMDGLPESAVQEEVEEGVDIILDEKENQ